jgi:hypothetical protein
MFFLWPNGEPWAGEASQVGVQARTSGLVMRFGGDRMQKKKKAIVLPPPAAVSKDSNLFRFCQ